MHLRPTEVITCASFKRAHGVLLCCLAEYSNVGKAEGCYLYFAPSYQGAIAQDKLQKSATVLSRVPRFLATMLLPQKHKRGREGRQREGRTLLLQVENTI